MRLEMSWIFAARTGQRRLTVAGAKAEIDRKISSRLQQFAHAPNVIGDPCFIAGVQRRDLWTRPKLYQVYSGS
jgi:hypothetical protein